MRRWLLLTGIVSLMSPAGSQGAGVRISIRLAEDPAPEMRERLQASETVIASLLASGSIEVPAPSRAHGVRYERISRAGYAPGLSESERRRTLDDLRETWKTALIVEDLPDVKAPGGETAAPRFPRRRYASQVTSRRVAAVLDVGGTRERQDLYYDQAYAKDAAPAVTGRTRDHGGGHTAPAAKGLIIKAPPAPSLPAAKPRVHWGKAGLEALKGVGEVVREVFTWQGLAIAAGAVAMVTVAPVAVYGLLALGVVMGGYTVAKAVYDGVKAHRKGDVDGVYAASREFGKGALTLGLSLYGARHVPKSLKPHIPRSGEFKALLSSMDDEAVVLTSMFDRFRAKPAGAH